MVLGHRILSLDVMQFVAFSFAAIFALFELTLTRIDRRVDASLDYATRFTEGKIAEQRRLLDRAWYARAKEFQEARAAYPIQEGQQEIAFAQAFLQTQILNPESAIQDRTRQTDLPPQGDEVADATIDLRLAIAEIADTLDQMALCVTPPCDLGICTWFSRCEASTAREHFCTYTLSFTNLYAHVLEDIERDFRTPPLGEEARKFAAEPACLAFNEGATP